jgi:hypothetical protein
MERRIFYGIDDNKKDITNIVYDRLVHENVVIIPKDDGERSILYGDHLFGIEKFIFINNAKYPNTNPIILKPNFREEGYKISYGIENNLKDITDIVFNKSRFKNIIVIPECDVKRSLIFSDHIPNTLKSVYVNDYKYPSDQMILLNYQYEKNLYLTHLNKKLHFGLFNQLWGILNALILAHYAKRDLMISGFYPDYNNNYSIDISCILDIEKVNSYLQSIDMTCKIVPYDNNIIWRKTQFPDMIFDLYKYKYERESKLDSFIRMIKFDDVFPNVDLISTFSCPIMCGFIDDERILVLSNKIKQCLIPNEMILKCINERCPTESYNSIHLRLEDDWLKHLRRLDAEFSRSVFDRIVKMIQLHMNDGKKIFISTGLGKSSHMNNFLLDEFVELFPKRIVICYDRARDWKELYSGITEGREIEAFIDYNICLKSDKFIGASGSTFSLNLIDIRNNTKSPSYVVDYE